MSEINQININNLEIIPINSHIHTPIHSLPTTPPVSLQIGSPIVDIPGCIKFNPANKNSLKLIEEDKRGTRTLCDGDVPYFFPMEYQPENLIYVEEPTVPTIKPSRELDTPEPNSFARLSLSLSFHAYAFLFPFLTKYKGGVAM